MTHHEKIDLLLASNGYREFITAYLRERKKLNAQYSIAALSRKGGFRSRSYAREVLTGRRKITAQSLPKFCIALELKGDEARYFSALVALSHPEIRVPVLSNEQLKNEIAILRSRILKKRSVTKKMGTAEMYGSDSWPYVFAALGDRETGASIEEIASRTGIHSSQISATLGQMCALQMAKHDPDSQRYFATSDHLVVPGATPENPFKDFYLKSLARIRDKAKNQFKSETDLFLNSILSVDQARLPALKDELKNLILRYIHTNENANGGKVATLVVGLATDLKL